MEFWSEAGTFGDLYRRIEQQAWQTEEAKPKKKGRGKESEPKEELPPVVREISRRNFLYEALGKAFRSPDFREEAERVAIRFFIPRGKQIDPNTTALAELFLEKVGGMEKTRLEAIRGIADALADSQDVKWVIDRLMRSGSSLYDYLPAMRAIQRRLSAEKKPIAWDQLLLALDLADEDDSTARDTRLVAELILIRIFERLGQAQPEILTEISTLDDSEPTTQPT